MKHFRSFNDELREIYGCKVYKLALDGGFTCPNRDGTLDTRGCLFCLKGSSAFAEPGRADIAEQITRAKERVAQKERDGRYIAYFQSYTATYAPVEKLRELFSAAIAQEGVCGLSVATRPDCLEDEKLRLLRELSGTVPVWVELGLQTMHEETARYIRRGYPLEAYDDAVARIKAYGLKSVTHMILCLPGESVEDMIATAGHIGRAGSDGIKLQLLHVLKGTDLEKEWRMGRVPLPEPEEYVRLLEEMLRHIPAGMTVHRLTGDGDKRDLLAPMWTADKKRVLALINRMFERDNVVQGELYGDRM